MIASWIDQLGWTKPPVVENTPAPVAQTAPETVAPTAAPSLDLEQMQQITQRLALLQQTVEQLAATQDQMAREITRLQATDVEILLKLPAPPPPQPPATATRKPMPVPPSSSRAPIAPPSSRAPIPPRQ